MDNKIILELVVKNLEEINLLVESLRNGEKADPLLIEITATKAKTLYQELLLLSLNEPFIVPKSQIDEPEVILAIEAEVENEETPEPEIENEELSISEATVTSESEISSEETSVNENITPPEPFIENEELSIIEDLVTDESEIMAEETSVPEDIPTPESENELNETSTPENWIEDSTYVEPEIKNESPLLSEIETSKTEIQGIKILGEQFVNEPSVYEKLAASSNHESKIKGKPVTNIMNAIGLNDRFLYIRELFGNNSNSFENSVDHIDHLNNLLEAIDYLEANFQWTKNEASLKFMELVKRRFEN
jgi:hypothetical protein